jgi:ferrous iron transport protein B
VLYALYLFVGVFGAQTLVRLLEDRLFGRASIRRRRGLSDRFIPFALVRDFLVGEYGLITMGVTYAIAIVLPVVATFFLMFGFLEDSGYIPRLAIFCDRIFRVMGLNGKAVLPMVLGLGCDTMATMTTRILGTPKERLIAILLLALGSPARRSSPPSWASSAASRSPR